MKFGTNFFSKAGLLQSKFRQGHNELFWLIVLILSYVLQTLILPILFEIFSLELMIVKDLFHFIITCKKGCHTLQIRMVFL